MQSLLRQLRENRKANSALPGHAPESPSQTVVSSPVVEQWLDQPLAPELAQQLNDIAESFPHFHASLAKLNAWQLRAVFAQDDAALVRAQVGSGKTAVLVHKVIWLHLCHAIPLADMAVLTFTNKAAREIRQRISALAQTSSKSIRDDDTWLVGTFHGVARALLQKSLPVERTGWTRNFRVLDETQRSELWQRLIEQNHLNIGYINKLPARMEALRRGKLRYGGMKSDDDLQELHLLAKRERQRINALDFDDLIELTVELLPLAQNAPPKWVIVDEFQDCEPRELQMLRHLRGETAKFFAVGDPMQVIYAWRGSSPKLFDKIQEEFGCVEYSLPVNYRSTLHILAAARAVLGKQILQQSAPTAELIGVRPAGERLVIRRQHNAFLEGVYLVHALQMQRKAGVLWREMAILFRMRRQGTALAAILRDHGIPCRDGARASADDMPAAKWLLRLLRTGLGCLEMADLRALLTDTQFGSVTAKSWNNRSWQVFLGDVPQIVTALQGQATTAADFLTALGTKKKEPRERRDLLDAADDCRILAGLPNWIAARAENELLAVELWQHLDLDRRLRPASQHHERDRRHARLLLDKVVQQTQRNAPTAQGWLNALNDLTLIGLPSLLELGDETVDEVKLLTLHSAKGLEFRYVYISGVNQGLVPLASTWGDVAADAEERRLLFVGITRARDQVELGYFQEPPYPQAQAAPSPYLYQMPAETTDWQDAQMYVQPHAAITPAQPATTAPALGAVLTFAAGQNVRHARYGIGSVTAATDDDITCVFNKFGEKTFSRLMCPLTHHG